jgi:hypothetical protein
MVMIKIIVTRILSGLLAISGQVMAQDHSDLARQAQNPIAILH